MNYTAKFNKKGNIKLGPTIWTFNKLAGSGTLGGIKGTCGSHCTGCYNIKDPSKSPCYVFKSYAMYGWEKSTVVKSHVRNTIIMRTNMKKAFEDLRLQIKRAKIKPTAVRIHASGEIESAQELHEWAITAAMFPKIPFYIYTKNYEELDKFLSSKIATPKNFFINISIWHEEGIKTYNKWKHIPIIKAFVYCDDYKYLFNLDCYCPAYNDKGKMNHDIPCQKCKKCFKPGTKIIGCKSH